jgi:RNA polymerase sigma-70 factor (ECF subfamily)
MIRWPIRAEGVLRLIPSRAGPPPPAVAMDQRRHLCDPSRVGLDGVRADPESPRLTGLDEESRQWLARLGSTGPDKPAAIQALFELLLRGARHETHRRSGSLPARVVGDLDDIARQAADDALAVLLRKLDDYRGASRFTTWAYKFAIFEVSAALRREAWRGRSITIEDESWDRMADMNPIDPHAQTEVRELVAVVERTVAADLTPRQRDVFIAIIVHGVPIDVVADRHGSSRGAVYKVLHDARQKLRLALAAQGWDVGSAGGAT